MKFKEMRLSDVCDVGGKSIKPKENEQYFLYSLPAYDNDKIPENVYGSSIKSNKIEFPDSAILYNKLNVKNKRVWSVTSSKRNKVCSTEYIPLVVNNNYDKDYVYYYITTDDFTNLMDGASKGTSTSHQRIDVKVLLGSKINVPEFEIQQKISKILVKIDNKIELNNKINKNLLDKVYTLYHKLFDKCSLNNVCRAKEYFDISIGKTPPRKETKWFSNSPNNNNIWISISDMGKNGIYISNSKEYLTNEAVTKFNIIRVPKDTVILSFKLTLGRVAITNNIVTTNEAIAHFKTNNKDINPYLYCYLNNYNFQSLGSTSSIATAINSNIIKDMPFIIPNSQEINDFNKHAIPSFSLIRNNEIQNNDLNCLRDSLLPKLMSGEIDVSKIDI